MAALFMRAHTATPAMTTMSTSKPHTQKGTPRGGLLLEEEEVVEDEEEAATETLVEEMTPEGRATK